MMMLARTSIPEVNMFRLSALSVLIPALSLAAPVPKAKEAELYFPTQEGTKRVMQMKEGINTTETTETVTKVEQKDGVYRVSLGREVGGRPAGTAQIFEVSAKGVFRLTSGGVETKTPYMVLKLGVKEGESWTSELDIPGRGGLDGTTGKTKHTLGQEEEIEVPAGKYKALRVESESDNNGTTSKSTIWIAPGVGIVKIESERGGSKMVQEMKSFTLGKDEPKKDDPKAEEKKGK